MDPDEALRQLRAAIADYHRAPGPSARDGAARRIAEHADALDRWMTAGGFPPATWTAARPPR